MVNLRTRHFFAAAALAAGLGACVGAVGAADAAAPTTGPAGVAPAAPNALTDAEKKAGFELLFDGKTLDGWKAQSPGKFTVEDGKIIANGKRGRGMLFYVGKAQDHAFKDFEFRAQVYTHPGGNSGIYFHTKVVDRGFPDAYGYEAQIATTHKNPQKTGSLYKVRPVKSPPVKDDEWFDYTICVKGRRVIIKLAGKAVVDYAEPEGDPKKSRLTGGTIGLQCHDPAVVEFRTVRIRKIAPDEDLGPVTVVPPVPAERTPRK